MKSTSIQYVIIPWDESLPLETRDINPSSVLPDNSSGENGYHLGECDIFPMYLKQLLGRTGGDGVVEVLPLKRMGSSSGVYAYHYSAYASNTESGAREQNPNTRATRLAMACGLHSCRFRGTVYIGRLGYVDTSVGRQLQNLSISQDEIQGACHSPDLRSCIQSQFFTVVNDVPDWLQNSARSNYQDGESLSALASVMMNHQTSEDSDDDDDDDDESCDDDGSTFSQSEKEIPHTEGNVALQSSLPSSKTLCLQCRGPSKSLCPACNSAYFCQEPRKCQTNGWSHQCICPTWQIYTERRELLSKFGLDSWYLKLIGRDCQLSDKPYEDFLAETLKVLKPGSWWATEIDGWSAGQSGSAKRVDASIRRSYEEGFSLDTHLIPVEHPVDDERWLTWPKDEVGLLKIESWEEYYSLRDIPLCSPVALLCTFPLTIYRAITQYGSVPLTVSKMLKRPMRIHVVGVEKEMNFLDLFKEVGFLLPQDGSVNIELTFVVRPDMLPPKCKMPHSGSGRGYQMRLDLASNLVLNVQSGVYGDNELNPNFDCGSGPPDIIMGMNAGLYAYESWRSVVSYLKNNPHVVGVFTDYNEHSGTNCASLGGGKARESLCINPFRQPRAMPVYCMNLPQFSNGFFYVYNEQTLDE